MIPEFAWEVPLTWSDLSPRQQEVMLAVARGLSNQEIADAFGISLYTVRNTIADLYDKLKLSSRVQALLWVMAYDDLATEILASVE